MDNALLAVFGLHGDVAVREADTNKDSSFFVNFQQILSPPQFYRRKYRREFVYYSIPADRELTVSHGRDYRFTEPGVSHRTKR